ncbi:hypothetical protein FB567DRAFT_552333 [Paraphoma chrysanthemicola]|uniref:Uncharacterized protein n=1 Tax=Paraphoma chrysanthemicola TaxID=798071 RepID=A0A8K0R0P0_9PLEO|nr:hypothetical protein FB567DRAFT_552333 [Paraphoma chrysanthemicola]
MYELISQPGFQFYILQLHGNLQWTFKGKRNSDKHGELTENDLRHAQDQIKAEDDTIMDGVKINAAGLKVRLVKNIGHLVLTHEARDGDTTVWDFQGLELLRKAHCVGTQTDPTLSVVIRGAKLKQKPLIDGATEACLRSHSRSILSILCEDPLGTRFKIIPGGVVKRLRASERPREKSTDDLPAARRTSARLNPQQKVTMVSSFMAS